MVCDIIRLRFFILSSFKRWVITRLFVFYDILQRLGVRAEDSIEENILGLIEASVEAIGYEIVRVRLRGTKASKSLQIMIDRKDGEMITVDDCEKVSQHVSALLDVEDPIAEAYNLEISSPGIDRPLTRIKDFINFAGCEVKLEASAKIDGQARFRGKLIGMEDNDVVLEINVVDFIDPLSSKRVKINFDSVKNAKLVMTDELMRGIK